MGFAWKGASVTRLMPTEESVELMGLVEDFASRELAPKVAELSSSDGSIWASAAVVVLIT